MSASNAFETDLLNLILCNLNAADIGDATGLRGSSAPGSVYVSLHTADPGEAGTQATSEATYAGYARVAVVRSVAGWTVTGNAFSNAVAISFPACTGGSNTITHCGIGTSASGAGKLLLSSGFTDPASLPVSTGIAPSFKIADMTGTVD